MKHILPLVFILAWQLSFCQTQTPSTVGQIYNFEVGDTFEYNWRGFDGAYEFWGSQLLVITSKQGNSDSVICNFLFYETGIPVNSNNFYGYVPYGQPFPKEGYFDYPWVLNYDNELVIIDEDSSILSGYSCYGCSDSVFSDTMYYGRKQDEYNFDQYANDYIYAEGLGLVSENIYNGSDDADFSDWMVYYHKASGEIWGTPLADTVFAGINNLANNLTQLKIFPNPATEMVKVDYSFTDWSTGGQVNLIIVNELGQVVYNQPVEQSSGYQRIDVSKYAAGIYVVYIKQNEQPVAVQRFTKE